MKKKRINIHEIIMFVILAAIMCYFFCKRSESVISGIGNGLFAFFACLIVSGLVSIVLTIAVHYMSVFLLDLSDKETEPLDIIDERVLYGLWGIIFIVFYIIETFNVHIVI